MIISPITNYTGSAYKPSFQSLGYTYSSYIDKTGRYRETQNTTGKRGDISLKYFAKIVKWRFRDFDTVNIMPMNVSDGTEAYAFANAIIRNEGLENFKNKYRVTASDITSRVICNYPRNGLLHLYDSEKSLFDGIGMDVLQEVNPEDYKSKIISQARYPDKLYKLSDEYMELFSFRVEDLQKRINDLQDDGNSVISIRNCLRQSFGSTDTYFLINKLAEKMTGASLFITGNYDREFNFMDNCLKEHFVELSHNIWGLKNYKNFENYFTKVIKHL